MIDHEMRVVIKQQIGMGNVLSISGGRVIAIPNGIELPVSNGYSVRVEYDEGWDDYTVTRVFKRGDKEFIHGSVEHVYCGELGQMAYRAGMFRSWDEHQWPTGQN